MNALARTVMLFTLVAPHSPMIAADTVAGINPADYPILTDKELGHVHRFVNLSRQLPGDWSGMSDDLWAVAERTRQFQLSYMAMALALVQHRYTPAYRELYREAMYDLIKKLTIPDIWESWLNSSRAGRAFADASLDDVTRGWIDPIRKYNIMLKGYLLQAGSVYEMLYKDGRFSKPDGFTFKYQPFTWGNGPLTFRYSLSDVAEIIYHEYVAGDYEGVQCEPNRIFPACNQLAILGLISHDQLFGTKYAKDVIPKFTRAWVEKNYTNPATGSNVRFIYVKQNDYVEPGTAVLDGWAGSWMHAWNPELIQKIYPKQRALYLEEFLNGSYARHAPEPGPAFGNRTLISLGFGQFAFMAAEVGDESARKALLAYADENFNPVWRDGAYYYPRNDDYLPDAEGNSHGMDSWTGNVLLALARLDKGSGFLKLYENPWGDAERESPYISEVDDVTTHVSRAWYDSEKGALVVTLEPGPIVPGQTSFVVRKLDRARRYAVYKDGQRMASDNLRWREDGSLWVGTDIAQPHTFIVVAEK